LAFVAGFFVIDYYSILSCNQFSMMATIALMDIKENLMYLYIQKSDKSVFEAMLPASSGVKYRILILRAGAVCSSKTLTGIFLQ
jgi:hypothetical protein